MDKHGWRRRETMPKNGTEIIMWSKSRGAAVWPACAAWDDVTHWKPLGPPPEGA